MASLSAFRASFVALGRSLRGSVHPKDGAHGYYKGNGAVTPGRLSRKGRFVVNPDKIPQFVVPDLKDFKLQPYVYNRVPQRVKTPMTTYETYLTAIHEAEARNVARKAAASAASATSTDAPSSPSTSA